MPPRFLKESLRGFEPYVPGLQPPDGEDWIKLNTNESPYPPPADFVAALAGAVVDTAYHRYPDRGYRALRVATGHPQGPERMIRAAAHVFPQRLRGILR